MGMLINSCKKNDSPSAESLVLGKLTRHLCLQSTFLVYIHSWYSTTYVIGSLVYSARLVPMAMLQVDSVVLEHCECYSSICGMYIHVRMCVATYDPRLL